MNSRANLAAACLLLLCVSLAPAADPSPCVVNAVERSKLRETINLDGAWEFAIDPKNVGEGEKWFDPGKAWLGAIQLAVPGCWEAQGVGGEGISKAVAIES